jgi:tRNA pseudouridine38-40 synthase
MIHRDLPSRSFRLTITYDGTGFSGWQAQPHQRTVEGVLRDALKLLTGTTSRLAGASRTDAGVHAVGQTADVALKTRLSPEQLLKAINALLPQDVSVTALSPCSSKFSARRDALRKTYCYTLLNRRIPDPFLRRTAWLVRSRLDVPAMERAAALLSGYRDFTSLKTKIPGAGDKSARLDLLVRVETDGDVIRILMTAPFFLYAMCRTIAGTLVDVGKGKIPAEDIPGILKEKNRSLAGPTAPPQGLCLMFIEY